MLNSLERKDLIIKEFYGLCCSLLSTLITLVNGENRGVVPEWGGIQGINNILDEIIGVFALFAGGLLILKYPKLLFVNEEFGFKISFLLEVAGVFVELVFDKLGDLYKGEVDLLLLKPKPKLFVLGGVFDWLLFA